MAQISGNITELGVGVQRDIHVINASTNQPVTQDSSSVDGSYSITGLDSDDFLVVYLDNAAGSDYNSFVRYW